MNLVMFFNNAKKYGLFIFVLFLLATICFGFIWCFFGVLVFVVFTL